MASDQQRKRSGLKRATPNHHARNLTPSSPPPLPAPLSTFQR
jgi:hypothetical protein